MVQDQRNEDFDNFLFRDTEHLKHQKVGRKGGRKVRQRNPSELKVTSEMRPILILVYGLKIFTITFMEKW